jgi:iron complex outermembrane receptor protein
MDKSRVRAALTLLMAAVSAQPAIAQAPASEEAPAPVSADQPPSLASTEAESQAPIIITGSRIPRPNLRSTSPIQTVRAAEFEVTGVPNVEQTLNQMPQLVGGFTNTSNNPGRGAATLDLRGLGSVRTLILVNGRRWIANDAGQSPEVDVNTIPAALIDRVDIVTGGASAVYGSDAVTGVINFVLRDKLDGLHVSATQNLTQKGDGSVSNVDVSYGGTWWDGRAKLIASVGWLRQEPVLQRDRVFSEVFLTEGCVVPGTRAPNGASTPAFDPDCAAPNEFGFIEGGSGTIPGTYINLPVFVPSGSGSALDFLDLGVRFGSDGEPVPFVEETDFYNFAPANYLQIGFRRKSANLFPSFEISPAITLYSELSYVQTKSPLQYAPVAAFLGFGLPVAPVALINLDNPFLTPSSAQVLDINFGVDAEGDTGVFESPEGVFSINPDFGGDADGIVALPRLLSRLEALGPRQQRNTRDARRGLIGARGDIAANWHYDLYFSSSRVKHTAAYENSASASRLQQSLLARRDASGAIACIDPSNGCIPANIFGPGNLSAEAADFLRTHPIDLTIIKEKVGEATVRGDIPWLPAGRMGLVGGATWRKTSYAFTPDPALFTGDDLGFDYGAPASGSTRVWELFGEARVPLLAERPFAHELTAELGGRYSRYDTVGGVWTWKALGDWSPMRGLRFRGGFQRAVRAPNVRELYEVETLAFPFALDPCAAEAGLLGNPEVLAACLRDGVPPESFPFLPFESGEAFGALRGNPDLEAETARTFTIGAVIAPQAVPGLTVTLDYYDIRIRDAIHRLGGDSIFMVMGCILGGGGDPAYSVCQGYDRNAEFGYLEFIDQPTANIPHIRVSGIDWQLAYRRQLPWGLFAGSDRLDLAMAGTRYLKAGMRPNEGLPELDCIGLLSGPCSFTVGAGVFPEWKLLNQLAYDSGPMSLTLRHRWFSATRDGRLELADRFGFTYYNIPAEGARMESRHYFDLVLSATPSDRFKLTFGVNNLTNRKPPVTGLLQVQANTDPTHYDVLGRRFFITATARIF